MNKICIVNMFLSTTLAVTAFSGVASAVEITPSDTMMKKNEMMMKDDSIMQKDTMMKSDSMMSPDVNLYFGSRGESVITLQTFLESHGFLVIPAGIAKGYFGYLTKVALAKYQESSNIRATGYYGPLTRVAMSKSMMTKYDDKMMKKDETSIMGKNDTMMLIGSYEAYAPEKVTLASETRDVILFFKASWCPTCRAVDADIKANLSKIPSGLTILDVNYDDSTILKKKYGVTYQHTFVQVDKDGNLIKKWSGSPTLSALVAEVQ